MRRAICKLARRRFAATISASCRPLFERILHQRGRPCGIQFCLAGPRAVRLTAYWEAAKRIVLFYDSTGERFSRIELTGSSLELLADEQAA